MVWTREKRINSYILSLSPGFCTGAASAPWAAGSPAPSRRNCSPWALVRAGVTTAAIPVRVSWPPERSQEPPSATTEAAVREPGLGRARPRPLLWVRNGQPGMCPAGEHQGPHTETGSWSLAHCPGDNKRHKPGPHPHPNLTAGTQEETGGKNDCFHLGFLKFLYPETQSTTKKVPGPLH